MDNFSFVQTTRAAQLPKAGKYALCGDTPIPAGIAAFRIDCVSEIAQRRLTANGCKASEDLRIRPL